MKPALLNAFAAMLPRLQAEELLALRSAVMYGTGSGKKDDEKQWLDRMKRLSGLSAGTRIRTLDDLRGTGIRVVEGGDG
jgi:hypothetical protein